MLTADTDKLRIARFCVLFARVSCKFGGGMFASCTAGPLSVQKRHDDQSQETLGFTTSGPRAGWGEQTEGKDEHLKMNDRLEGTRVNELSTKS